MKSQATQETCFIKEHVKLSKLEEIQWKSFLIGNMTPEEVQKMIDVAIDRHNKTATMISASIGSILLFFYAHGVISIIDRVK